ncbi:hypothetical protein [Sphingobacterium mizutaii]|uniref:hypothetical protein n=1 Tax=Sphingobacterium mizutaii TaxID=1010 RepID=UPI0016240046|nr:hypothetical protein [Sphingobacterium mizutaii]
MEQTNQKQPIEVFPKNPILFRFCFILITLFIILINNNSFFFLLFLERILTPVLTDLLKFLASGFVKFDGNMPFRSGSGDTTLQWLLLLLISIVSIIGCIIWTLIDRKNKVYPRLYYWLTVLIRYYIAITMLMYGFVKVFSQQFPTPDLIRLTEPLYKFSPMGLAWTFYGASPAYNIFIGIAEMLGVLLLFRKTTTLGALIMLGVSINVMATNYFYDVPVKMVSTALVLFSLFLLAPNIKRFYMLLIKQEPVQLCRPPQPTFSKRWKRIAFISIKYLFIILTIASLIPRTHSTRKYIAQLQGKKSELYGAYYIPFKEHLNRKKINMPDHWHYLIFTNENSLTVRDESMDLIYYQLIPTKDSKEFRIVGKYNEPSLDLKYRLKEDGLILMETDSKDSTSIFLEKIDMENIDLKTRTFRWVQDYPYNR